MSLLTELANRYPSLPHILTMSPLHLLEHSVSAPPFDHLASVRPRRRLDSYLACQTSSQSTLIALSRFWGR